MWTGMDAMFNSAELRNELHALKREVAHLLGTTDDSLLDGVRNGADALADQIKSALNELGETMAEKEDHVEALIAERPIATLASAFALGVVIGFMLRRR